MWRGLGILFMAVACDSSPSLLPSEAAPAPRVLSLDVTALVPGAPVTMRVGGTLPGSNVFLVRARGLGLAATCPPQLSPECLDLVPPVTLMTSGSPDSQGVTTFNFTLPTTVAATQVAFQAAARFGSRVDTSVPLLVQVLAPGDDEDGDGLTNLREARDLGTDPREADSDGGGTNDGDEVAAGLDPLNPVDDGLNDTAATPQPPCELLVWYDFEHRGSIIPWQLTDLAGAVVAHPSGTLPKGFVSVTTPPGMYRLTVQQTLGSRDDIAVIHRETELEIAALDDTTPTELNIDIRCSAPSDAGRPVAHAWPLPTISGMKAPFLQSNGDYVDFVGTAACEGSAAVVNWFVEDLTGDGWKDLVVASLCSGSPPGGWHVYPGDGLGFGAVVSWAVPSGYNYSARSGMDTVSNYAWDLLDFTGDGHLDLVRTDGGSTSVGTTRWLVYPNTGAGFGAEVIYLLPVSGKPTGFNFLGTNPANHTDTYGTNNWDTFDLDGDGWPDLVLFTTDGRASWRWWRGGPAGFSAAQEVAWELPDNIYGRIPAPVGDLDCSSLVTTEREPARLLADMNGDGALDLVVTAFCGYPDLGVTHWWVHENTGSGFAALPNEYPIPDVTGLGALHLGVVPNVPDDLEATDDCRVGLLDMDGDSLSDLVVFDACGLPPGDAAETVGDDRWWVFRNVGGGFSLAAESLRLPGGNHRGLDAFDGSPSEDCRDRNRVDYVLSDLDGDGRVEPILLNSCSSPTLGRDAWGVLPGLDGESTHPVEDVPLDSGQDPTDVLSDTGDVAPSCGYGELRQSRPLPQVPLLANTLGYPQSNLTPVDAELFDLDADGFQDLIVYRVDDQLDRADLLYDRTWLVYSGHASGFSASPAWWHIPYQLQWPLPDGAGVLSGPRPDPGFDALLDMNGDERLDFIRLRSNGDWSVYQNTGDGFNAVGVTWDVQTWGTNYNDDCIAPDENLFLRDMNGDGLVDWVLASECDPSVSLVGETHWQVYFNNGTEFSTTALNWSLPGPQYTGAVTFDIDRRDTISCPRWAIEDMNADGWMDLVVTLECGMPALGATHWNVHLGSISGFASVPTPWSVPGARYGTGTPFSVPLSGVGCPSRVSYRVLDMTRDGRPDLLVTGGCRGNGIGERRWMLHVAGPTGFAAAPIAIDVPGERWGGDSTFSGDAGTRRDQDCVVDRRPFWELRNMNSDTMPELVLRDVCVDATVGRDKLIIYSNTCSP
jgi:hypothetical protein